MMFSDMRNKIMDFGTRYAGNKYDAYVRLKGLFTAYICSIDIWRVYPTPPQNQKFKFLSVHCTLGCPKMKLFFMSRCI